MLYIDIYVNLDEMLKIFKDMNLNKVEIIIFRMSFMVFKNEWCGYYSWF